MLLVDFYRDEDSRYQANNAAQKEVARDGVFAAISGDIKKNGKYDAKQTGGEGDEQRLDENQDPQKQLFQYGTPLGIR